MLGMPGIRNCQVNIISNKNDLIVTKWIHSGFNWNISTNVQWREDEASLADGRLQHRQEVKLI